MEQAMLRILLIEDSEGDTRLLEEELTDAGLTAFQVTYADRLSQAILAQEPASFDVVLLDLSLPDSKGLETVRRAVAGLKDVPILVLTTLDDETLAMKAIAAGAQDYLIKGEAEGHEIVRAVRRAMARHAWTGDRRVTEIRAVTGPPERPGTSLRPEVFGDASIPARLPAAFEELGAAHGEIIERVAAGGDGSEVSRGLVALAEGLGILHAGPRDVLELHARMMASRNLVATPPMLSGVADQMPAITLELMGHLAAFYRGCALTREGGERSEVR